MKASIPFYDIKRQYSLIGNLKGKFNIIILTGSTEECPDQQGFWVACITPKQGEDSIDCEWCYSILQVEEYLEQCLPILELGKNQDLTDIKWQYATQEEKLKNEEDFLKAVKNHYLPILKAGFSESNSRFDFAQKKKDNLKIDQTQSSVKSFVYFIRVDNLIKVGLCNDITNELEQFKSRIFKGVELLYAIRGGNNLLNKINTGLNSYSKGNGWFDASPKVLDIIKKAKDKNWKE